MSNQKEMNSTPMINKHLIKRSSKFKDTSPSFNLNEGGWICEVKIGSRPSGYKVKKRDIIYVAWMLYIKLDARFVSPPPFIDSSDE